MNWPERFAYPSTRLLMSPEAGEIPIEEEISLYLIHGWLHIIGFDDLEQIDREVMRLEEQRVMGYIKKLSLWPDFRLAQNLHD